MDRLPTMRFLEAIMQSQLQKPHYSVNPLSHKPDTQEFKKLKKLHKPKLPKAAKESNRISQLTQKRLNRNEKATVKSKLKNPKKYKIFQKNSILTFQI
jgi:hypothetical protein